MDDQSADSLAASVFSLGVCLDFIRREDVVRWADRRFQELNQPPIWLIELSLSQQLHVLDFIPILKNQAEAVEPSATCRAVYALFPEADGLTFHQAEAMAKFVYQITRECLGNNWENPLLGEIDEIADNFMYVRDGFTNLSDHEAIKQFTGFVARFRNNDVRMLLAPVSWSRTSSDLPPNRSAHESQLVHVGIDAWIVQDGNYGDFAAGDECKFALEFHSPEGLGPVSMGPGIMQHRSASRYRIRAKIAFVNQGVWAIDTGTLVAYQERQPPAFAVVGTWVEGEIYLGIDPFFYLEYLHKLSGIPPMIYSWRVKGIMRETTPWLNASDPNWPGYVTRDTTKESFVPSRETKAWDDDSGNAHYILECERLGGPDRPATT